MTTPSEPSKPQGAATSAAKSTAKTASGVARSQAKKKITTAAASNPWTAAAVAAAAVGKKAVDKGRSVAGDGAAGTARKAGKAAAGGASRRARAVIESDTARSPVVWVVIAVVLVLLFIPAMAVMSLAGTNPNPLAIQLATTPVAASGGSADIPPIVYEAYVRAAGQASALHPNCELRPAILAGIGWKETTHGTYRGAVADANGDVAPPIIGIPLNGTNNTRAISDTDDGSWDGDTVWDRAVGPMQFIPTSWRIFGQDGNGDGVINPHNIFDAALAAVDHLCGASPVNMNESDEALRSAIFAYNHVTAYVDSVMDRIAYYDLALAAGGGFSADGAALEAHPNFSACDGAMNDLRSGIVDGRLITLLSAIVQTHQIYVCTFKSGHSRCVAGTGGASCSESHHWYGRAADIITVDGSQVSPSNAGARAIVEWLTTIPVGDVLYPDDMGSPWPEFDPLPAFFSDANHVYHLHIGMCGPRIRDGQQVDC